MSRQRIIRRVFFWLWLLAVPASVTVLFPAGPRAFALIPLVAAGYSLFTFLTRNRGTA